MRARTLRERILGEIRDYIARGKLKPGDPLPTEQHFADQLGVSRTVVREAMKGLESLGLVEARTRRGYRLKEVDLDGIVNALWFIVEADPSVLPEVVEAHRIIQLQALPLVVERATEADWARLQELNHRMEQEVEREGIPAELDEAFHTALAEASHNRPLARFEEVVGRFLRIPRTRLFSNLREAEKAVKEHDRLIKALQKGQVEEAREILEKHLEGYGRRGVLGRGGEGSVGAEEGRAEPTPSPQEE